MTDDDNDVISEDDLLRQAVEEQYVLLNSHVRIVGGGNVKDVIAERMVEMYRIAGDRLDCSPELLRMLYVDSPAAPKPLRDVIVLYLDEKLTKMQTIEKLKELKTKTKQYVKELGADPDKAKQPAMILLGGGSAEDELRPETLADSLSDDQLSDSVTLFLCFAENFLYNSFAGLAKKLGEKTPTTKQLIDAQTSAFRQAHEQNPTLGFGSEQDFETWITKMEKIFESQGDAFLKNALHAYNKSKEMVTE